MKKYDRKRNVINDQLKYELIISHALHLIPFRENQSPIPIPIPLTARQTLKSQIFLL